MAGVCASPCPAGTDFRNDRDNCGSCGIVVRVALGFSHLMLSDVTNTFEVPS
jgi:hypothetical protein